MKNEIEKKLYLCATPIGNLGDITLRTLETLKGVDKIYCEDTRNTLKLLNALDIKKPLESCHEHNERLRADRIADEVRSGLAVAFVSDAGMPGVSDPGSVLIQKFIAEELPFSVLPGASAMTTAWIMSGLDTSRLYFIGFLPRTGAERGEALRDTVASSATVALYESPLRVGATLGELASAIEADGGNPFERPCALCRELTKTFEECVRGSVGELAERFAETAPRGECVILIGGAAKNADSKAQDAKLTALLNALLNEGVSVRSASRIAADTLGAAKNTAYKLANEINKTLSNE